MGVLEQNMAIEVETMLQVLIIKEEVAAALMLKEDMVPTPTAVMEELEFK